MSTTLTPADIDPQLRYSFIKDLIALEIDDIIHDHKIDNEVENEDNLREDLTLDYLKFLKGDLL